MPTVTFLREGKEIEVEKGANLRKAAMDAGVSVYQGPAKLLNCLGNGLCGTCLVYVREGEENASEKGIIESMNLNFHPITVMHTVGHEEEARLSCQMQVHGDMVVDTQPQMNIHGEEEHAYARKLKGKKYVEFPDQAPRGVREKQKRREEGKEKDWFHENRPVKEKSGEVKDEKGDEDEQTEEQEEDGDEAPAEHEESSD